jgi:hypothetical protein
MLVDSGIYTIYLILRELEKTVLYFIKSSFRFIKRNERFILTMTSITSIYAISIWLNFQEYQSDF